MFAFLSAPLLLASFAVWRAAQRGWRKVVPADDVSVEAVALFSLLGLAITLWLMSAAAHAGTSAGYRLGGQFSRFDPVVAEHNRTGALMRIESHCQLACTLFLGIRNVCIEPGAELLFHAGHDRNRAVSAKWTSHMLAAYKPALRHYLVANHYVDTLEFHTISGRDMIAKFGYRAGP